MPMTIDRGRAGIRLASRDHGASPRAAPRPPATRASRKDATTACHSEGDGLRRPARHRQRPGEQRVGQRQRDRRVADVPQLGDRAGPDHPPPGHGQQRARAAAPARAAAGRSGPAPRTVKPT